MHLLVIMQFSLPDSATSRAQLAKYFEIGDKRLVYSGIYTSEQTNTKPRWDIRFYTRRYENVQLQYEVIVRSFLFVWSLNMTVNVGGVCRSRVNKQYKWFMRSFSLSSMQYCVVYRKIYIDIALVIIVTCGVARLAARTYSEQKNICTIHFSSSFVRKR